jgi:aspartyl-tRNA(Asn)/glutamyl-tRNA(Gln) amidotransferase subunit B
MEEGSLRVDGNLSVRRPGAPLGTKQEVKNMNSFAAVERALVLLRDQQIATLEAGKTVELTTFSAATGNLRPMRTKEESQDYRYFPDADIPPLSLRGAGIDVVAERKALPELPADRRRRYVRAYGIPEYDAAVLSDTRAVGDYYEAVVSAGTEGKTAANWVMGSVLADAKEHGGALRVSSGRVAELARMVETGTVSLQAAKKVFAELAEQDGAPADVARRMGLVQVGDADQIAGWVDAVIAAHPDELGRYRKGEAKLVGFFMGQIMKQSGGRADPKQVQPVLKARLLA